MYILLLFISFSYHINGLLCVVNGIYENDIGKFTDALYQLAKETVNNTKIIVTLKHQERKILIKYYGNSYLDDTNNLQRKFLYLEKSVDTKNIFTYVYSTNDYCDRQYIENWSQYIFNISLIQLQINDNHTTKSYICYQIDIIKNCFTHISYGIETITNCALFNIPSEMMEVLQSVLSVKSPKKMVLTNIETALTNIDLFYDDKNMYLNQNKYKFYHKISYYCSFNKYNSPSILKDIKNEINLIYDVKKILSLITSTQNQTNLI